MQTLQDYENLVKARLDQMKAFATPETLGQIDNQIEDLKNLVEATKAAYLTRVDANTILSVETKRQFDASKDAIDVVIGHAVEIKVDMNEFREKVIADRTKDQVAYLAKKVLILTATADAAAAAGQVEFVAASSTSRKVGVLQLNTSTNKIENSTSAQVSVHVNIETLSTDGKVVDCVSVFELFVDGTSAGEMTSLETIQVAIPGGKSLEIRKKDAVKIHSAVFGLTIVGSSLPTAVAPAAFDYGADTVKQVKYTP